jgi:predicted nucleic acid-binding Zn ribbon protein
MRYDYRCEKHGVMEMSHSMKESREGRLCPECNAVLKPIISGGAQILLTGRPPWAYNDVIKSASKSEDQKNGLINSNTTVTDKRDGSKSKGQKQKINNSMGVFKAQW